MKKIEDYTVDELSEKIKAIIAEREKTASALKKYEEELERRKKVLPLGVPIKGTLNDIPYEAVSRAFIRWFACEASADKFEEYFVNLVKALQDIAEGKPIDIQVLLPLLKKGWVWMQDDKRWYWSKEKPEIFSNAWRIWNDGYYTSIFAFNIKPANDWRNSLKECGI